MLWAFHIWPLLCWGRVLLCPFFKSVFIINGCWILPKAFSASIEIIIWFLSFYLLIQFITLIDLHILKNPCIPRINPTWSWCMRFLMYWILFARILLRIFASIFISDIGPQFSFVVVSLSGFGIRVMVASWNEFGSLPSSTIFWKSLSMISVSSSLNSYRIQLWSHLVLGFCLLEDFWLQFQFLCLWWVCYDFLFLPGSVLEG